MELTNRDIFALANNGILATTEHDAPASEALRYYKFRKAVGKAFEHLLEMMRDLPKVAGVEDGQQPTPAQDKKLSDLQNELFAEKVDLGDIAPISYEVYHLLAAENRAVELTLNTPDGRTISRKVDALRACEGILDGVLFVTD